jgi:hypothetical protein
MDWANPVDSVKSTQSNLEKWVGSDNWIDMGLKNEKPKQKIGLRAKSDPIQKKPLTHNCHCFLKYFL